MFIEQNKSDTALYMKLAEFGVKIDETEDVHKKILSEDDYLYMRGYMMEKLGSWTSKYLAPVTAAPAAATKGGGKKGGGRKAGPSKAELIVQKNTIKLLAGDVDSMRVGDDVCACEIKKWHQPASLLLYCLYWGLHVIHVLKGKYKVDGKKLTVSQKIAMDCYMSLYRASQEMRDVAPAILLEDTVTVDALLKKQLVDNYGPDLLGLLVTLTPELISDTFYDTVKPKNIMLYEEQTTVLRKINESLSTNQPLLLGYQVPPSGGKTILSVAIASMLAHKFRQKKVLYICYNTLVRKAVANACAQAAVPFWVASSRQLTGGEQLSSAIRPSNSCLNMNRRAKRERYLQALSSGFRNKEGPMEEMFARANSQTVHHCPIIVADLASAIILLELYPDDFVAYVDGKIVC